MTNPIQQVDVLIAGSGSAGLAAATWLSIYNQRSASASPNPSPSESGVVLILDKRPAPMEMGQADGVQCRTVEIFESFGLKDDLLRDAYHVLEVAFWRDDDGSGLKRTRRTMDTERGLSWCPHVILNQARVNKLLVGKMQRENGLGVRYGWEVRDVVLENDGEYVRVTAVRSCDGFEGKEGETRVWRARYVLACDGAHSNVRRSIGYKMLGDSSDAVWGVMDVYPRTNFPDIRKKATIHSKDAAFIIIPREGGSLCRFYIEMPEGTKAKDVTLHDLVRVAKKMFGQYELDIAGTYWWSAYSIGQRLAEKFSLGNRVFLTGDACHTHSPKAGQGMNVSLQDGYNIGWKLGMVLNGLADETLLQTYDVERGEVARDLIEFDRRWTKTFSPRHAKDVAGSADPEFFANEFIKAGRYTAGLTARYNDTILTDAKRSLRGGEVGRVVVGMRCPSAQVVRFCDAKAMQLAQAMPSDGRWRLVIFAGDITDKTREERLNKLATYLDSPTGPVRIHTPSSPSPSTSTSNDTSTSTDIDSLIDPLIILHGNRTQIQQEQLHPYFWPATGQWQLRDLHKTFIDEESYNSGHGRCYEHFGIEPEGDGVVVVVRPDNYVAMVVGMEEFDKVGGFFEGVFTSRVEKGVEGEVNGHR